MNTHSYYQQVKHDSLLLSTHRKLVIMQSRKSFN